MQTEIQKKRVEMYGSFLYCPAEGRICAAINTPDGRCKYERCNVNDPEYVGKESRKKARMQENARKERQNKMRADDSPPSPLDPVKELKARIERMELAAQRAYKENNPRKGDRLMQKMLNLQGQLNAERKRAK